MVVVKISADQQPVRAKALAARGLRSHTASVDEPHVVVIIDELATLTALADRSVTNRFEKALGLLLTQGRACGITVVASSTPYDYADLATREPFSGRGSRP